MSGGKHKGQNDIFRVMTMGQAGMALAGEGPMACGIFPLKPKYDPAANTIVEPFKSEIRK